MLIYVRNSMGPKTQPCGTLEDTWMLSEFDPFNNTNQESLLTSLEYSHLCL